MEKNVRGKALVDAYQRAGVNFLVYKLESMFRMINTDADRIRHNDMLEELQSMLGINSPNFLKMVASSILARGRKRKAKKEFLETVAGKVITSSFIPTKGKSHE